jgi:hypothetical protein
LAIPVVGPQGSDNLSNVPRAAFSGRFSGDLQWPVLGDHRAPIDISAPPEDAGKMASGLAVKKLTARESGATVRRGDTVMVHYTGWRQRTGETFFTTKRNSQPLSLDVEHAAPAFTEALQLLHKGEKVVLWVPRMIRLQSHWCTRSS